MQEKIAMIAEWRSGRYSITELCKRFEISRPTAYKYMKRYQEKKAKGTRLFIPIKHLPRSKRGLFTTVISIQDGVVKRYRNFSTMIPCISTINRILKRNGLVRTKRRRRSFPIFDPHCCNEVWSADFRGKFKMGNKNPSPEGPVLSYP